MRIKTLELTGSTLDWAVAKCEGLLCFGYYTDNERFAVELSDGEVEDYMPSTDWSLAGPIIESAKISVWARTHEWAAESYNDGQEGIIQTGETPLIAAMRCYVASKLGDEIE